MKKLLIVLLTFTLFTSCKKDNQESENEETSAIMEVEKDGVMFSVNVFNNTLIKETQFGEDGSRLDLRCTVDGGTLILSVSHWDWQNPLVDGIVEKSYDTNTEDEGPNTVCMEGDNVKFCDGGLATYLSGSTLFSSGFIEDEGPGIITILKNDNIEKTVSGSFDIIVLNFITEEKVIFKGTFKNLKYN